MEIVGEIIKFIIFFIVLYIWDTILEKFIKSLRKLKGNKENE